MKKCIACGMPMVKKEDHAMADVSKDYCKFCANKDGTMQNFDQKLESLSGFIIKTQGLDASVAKETARKMMSKLPAWEKHST